jgi:hypothetical protein
LSNQLLCSRKCGNVPAVLRSADKVPAVCCVPHHSNTLELPDYAEALIATQPTLKQERAAACQAQRLQQDPGSAGSQVASDAWARGCPQLTQACRALLEVKLKARQSKRATGQGLQSILIVFCLQRWHDAAKVCEGRPGQLCDASDK